MADAKSSFPELAPERETCALFSKQQNLAPLR